MSEPPNQPASQQRSKNVILFILLAIFFVQGFGDYFLEGLEGYRLYSILWVIVNTLFIVWWFVLDARERQFKMSRALITWFALLSPVAAPYYFIKTRGKKGFVSILLAVLFIGLVMIVYGLGDLAADTLVYNGIMLEPLHRSLVTE